MTATKATLKLLATCLAYSSITILIDSVLVLLFSKEPNQIIPTLSLIMLVEGGLGLTIGGATALYSPIISKMGEVLFRSKPWNATRQKEVEKQAKAWIVTGTILVLLALLISAL